MSTIPVGLQEQIKDVLLRVERLEKAQAEERPSPRWQYLVSRAHPWKRQLWIKGRNMTATQLVSSMKANRLDDEQAAVDFELPLDVVREAVRYCDEQAQLLDLEASEERRRLAEKGYQVESASVSR